MAALTGDRNTPTRDGKILSLPVKAGAKIFAGSLVVLDAGYAKPGAAATGLKAVGRADAYCDNTGGADGALRVAVRRGCFRFDNSASGDAIALSDYGATCYVVDDHTVAKTDGSGARSAAGIIRDVDAQGVWVEF